MHAGLAAANLTALPWSVSHGRGLLNSPAPTTSRRSVAGVHTPRRPTPTRPSPGHRRCPRLSQPPFDQPRQALVPPGWTLSVWARLPKARWPHGRPTQAAHFGTLGEMVTLTMRCAQTPESRCCWRAWITTRPGIRRLDAVRRRERPGRRTTYADGAVTTAALSPRPARCQQPGSARSVCPCPQERRRGRRRRGVLLDRLDRQHLRRGPRRDSAARDDHAGSPRGRAAHHSRQACETAPAWPSPRTARYGPRSTIATMSADPPTGGSIPNTSTNIRPSRSRADAWSRIGLAILQSRRRPRGLRLIRDVQTNPDGTELDCATLPPVEQGLGAHSAPLGMSFAQNVCPSLTAPAH